MKPKTSRRLLLLAAALATALTAQAQQVISVNVYNNGGTPRQMTATDVAGAVYRVANWNNFAPNTSVITTNSFTAGWTYNDGTAIASSAENAFTVSSSVRSTWANPAEGTNDSALFSGLSELQNGTPLTFTLNNIPFAQYEIYVYATRSGAKWGGSVSIGSETFYLRNGNATVTSSNDYVKATTTSFSGLAADANTIEAGANYSLFTSLTGSSQTITIQALDLGDGNPYRFNVYGFQIVEVIPEPSSAAALAGLVCLVGVTLRRRRRAA